MASEEELATVSEQIPGPNGARVNVLKTAPPGSVQPARPRTDIDMVCKLGTCHIYLRHRLLTHRDIPQSAEDSIDPLAKTIVVHPGSRFLRIGRASDAYPVRVPNLVARKSRGSGVHAPQSCPLAAPTMTPFGVHPADPPTVPARAGAGDDSDEESANTTQQSQPTDPLSMKIASVRTDFKVRMRAFNLRGQGSANDQARAYNETVEPERLETFNDPGEIDWTDSSTDAGKDVLVGEKVLRGCVIL